MSHMQSFAPSRMITRQNSFDSMGYGAAGYAHGPAYPAYMPGYMPGPPGSQMGWMPAEQVGLDWQGWAATATCVQPCKGACK